MYASYFALFHCYPTFLFSSDWPSNFLPFSSPFLSLHPFCLLTFTLFISASLSLPYRPSLPYVLPLTLLLPASLTHSFHSPASNQSPTLLHPSHPPVPCLPTFHLPPISYLQPSTPLTHLHGTCLSLSPSYLPPISHLPPSPLLTPTCSQPAAGSALICFAN